MAVTATSTKSPNFSSSVMPQTVRSRTLPFHPRPALSRKVRVAQDIGVSESVADKYLYGERAANLIYAAILESDLRAGDTEAVAVWRAPAEAAEMGSDVLSLMEALTIYDAADVAEDVEQVALNRKCAELMTDTDLDTYARKIAHEMYAAARCLAAIRKVQRDRKAAAK